MNQDQEIRQRGILCLAFLASLGVYELVAHVLASQSSDGLIHGKSSLPLEAAYVAYAIYAFEIVVMMPLVTRQNQGKPQAAGASFIVRCALFESGAIYGLVLRMSGLPAIHQHVFSGLAALGLISAFLKFKEELQGL